jgi:hypothetical protein
VVRREDVVIAGMEGVTLFCRLPVPGNVIQALRAAGAPVRASGRWKELYVPLGQGSLRLAREMFTPGGALSRIVLDASAAVGEAEADAEARATVLSVLQGCDMVLAISFAPPLSDGDVRWAAVLAVADATGALLFDGVTFADAAERPLVEI